MGLQVLGVSHTAVQLLGFFPYQCVYHGRKCQVNSICLHTDTHHRPVTSCDSSIQTGTSEVPGLKPQEPETLYYLADPIYESFPFPTAHVIPGSDINLRLKFPGASPKVRTAAAPTPPPSAG